MSKNLISSLIDYHIWANRQVWKLLEDSGEDMRIGEHLWTGISKVRAGAGVAIVGNPDQVAETINEFVDAGCTSCRFHWSRSCRTRAATNSRVCS